MANSVNGPGSNVDELRYKSYLGQIERDQEATIREKQDEHREHLTQLVTTQAEQSTALKKDYDVRISAEAEALENRLGSVRERNQAMVAQEKENGEMEAAKIHQHFVKRIEDEKQLGDEQIQKLQSYYKKSSEELHKQYERDRARTAQKGKPA